MLYWKTVQSAPGESAAELQKKEAESQEKYADQFDDRIREQHGRVV